MRPIDGRRVGLRQCGALALLMVLSAPVVSAQSGASTGLRGRVNDSTGAAIPGVTVTLTSVDTASERVVVTDARGEWEARFLAPGTYRVNFELTGFKQMRREGITVSTAEMPRSPTIRTTLRFGCTPRIVRSA